jgi:predicted nucleic acid-binding protein
MVLVDTSVWISHLRDGNTTLADLLNGGNVVCHPFIVGELACGNLKNRDEILKLLQALSVSVQAEHAEVMQFIANHPLMGRGLGYVDIHLLASAALTGVPFWTLDKRLIQAAQLLGLHFFTEK